MSNALKGKAPTKRDFERAWTTTLSGWSWWGDSYMAIRGVPFWPDLEVEDLEARQKRSDRRFSPTKLRAALLRVIRQHNRGETLPIRVSDIATFESLGGPYPVCVARSARNGQAIRGSDGGPCVINAGFASLLERRIKDGQWFVSADRQMFIYDVAGRARAIVMGIRTGGRPVVPSHSATGDQG
jgi:hypothetical protein